MRRMKMEGGPVNGGLRSRPLSGEFEIHLRGVVLSSAAKGHMLLAVGPSVATLWGMAHW